LILLCYDGSVDAQAAIERAGELLSGQPATVLTVWEGFAEVLARTGSGLGVSALNFEEIDETCEQRARARAQEGVERARQAGFVAEPRVQERGATVWGTVLEQADDVGADAIVLGTRGLTGLKSLLLGSVSSGVIQHADRPVIVVPSPAVAAKRAAERVN
jgi:nucleotide-binding universal stress UspA family protein